MPRRVSEDQPRKQLIDPQLEHAGEYVFMVARVESMRSRQAMGERQVNGLFESMLAESFQ